MTLLESSNLMNDPEFRNRVKAAGLQFAAFIQTQPNNATSRNSWAQRMVQQPDQMAAQLVGAVVMNTNVQNAGKDVSDNDLAAAVQVVAALQM